MSSSDDSSQPPTDILRRTYFDKQFKLELVERVLKQTIVLISDMERKTPWRDQLGPDDRLNTAVVKTLEGKRRWDPDRVDLGGHLFGVISSQIEHEIKRGKKRPHFSLEDDEHQNLGALQHEMEDALQREFPISDEVPISPVFSMAIAALREAALDERDVLKILDAYDQSAFTKRDVIRVTKLKSKAYDRAFARLIELAQTLDEETRDLIQQAIA